MEKATKLQLKKLEDIYSDWWKCCQITGWKWKEKVKVRSQNLVFADYWHIENWSGQKMSEERKEMLIHIYIHINWNIAFINCSITHLAISWEIGKKKGRRRGKNLRNPKKPRVHLTGMESMKTSSLMEDIGGFISSCSCRKKWHPGGGCTDWSRSPIRPTAETARGPKSPESCPEPPPSSYWLFPFLVSTTHYGCH